MKLIFIKFFSRVYSLDPVVEIHELVALGGMQAGGRVPDSIASLWEPDTQYFARSAYAAFFRGQEVFDWVLRILCSRTLPIIYRPFAWLLTICISLDFLTRPRVYRVISTRRPCGFGGSSSMGHSVAQVGQEGVDASGGFRSCSLVDFH